MKRRRVDDVPPISVVISTLNRRDSVERVLVALRDQTYERFEVVVVNGPSTDATGELLAKFADRVRSFDCPDASVGMSRNVGVRHAAGEIVAFIDDDAIPREDWLQHMYAPFKDERVSSVGGPVFDVPLDRFDWRICTATRLGEVNVDSPAPISQYQGVGNDPFPYFAGCNVGHRRDALRSIGGFNAALPYAYEDTEVCCRLNDAGGIFKYVEALQVSHFRDMNPTRDGVQVIVDPFALALGRVVFAAHVQRAPEGREEVLQLARVWEKEWESHAAAHLASGRFTVAEHDWFIARAVAGTSEGIARGAAPRVLTELGAAPSAAFRRYN